jgi:TetR/AcrR family transcriptional regulator, tetracycline repressor protein
LDEIIDEALRILREGGSEGLTMRAVAAGLGVTPMAVYYYVDDKEDLLRMAADRVSARWGPLTLQDGDWEASLRKHLLGLWGELRRYSGLSTYLLDQPTIGVTPSALAQGIGFFEEAGFPPETAPLAWSFAMTYIHGRISVDARLARRPDAPRVSGLRAPDYVEYGVDAVIAGLRALCEAPVSRPRRSR